MRDHSLAITSLKTVKRCSIINNVIQDLETSWRVYSFESRFGHALPFKEGLH